MSILTLHSQNDVDAIAEEKQVWDNFGVYIVRTGDDMENIEKPRILAQYEFRDKFRDDQIQQLTALAYNDGNYIAQKVLLWLQTASDGVPLDDPRTQLALDFLVQAQIITKQERLEILE